MSGNTSSKAENAEEEKPFKVEKWDQNAVRIALDDAAKKIILDNLGYEEDFNLIDSRLAICTAAVMFALFALLWDFLYPFPASRPVLILCVLSYFVLMVILTLYSHFKERNIFLLAREKDEAGVDPDIVWSLASTMARFDREYSLEMVVKEPQSNRNAKFTSSVGEYFDENGILLMNKFQTQILKVHSSLSKKKKSQ